MDRFEYLTNGGLLVHRARRQINLDTLFNKIGSKEDAMSRVIYTEEFRRDAVAQVKDRGYSVLEVPERLEISNKSLYTWINQFSKLD